ncbi:MAG TPA: hypothetical protein PK611_10090, partial [Saprospiraceae bacterium]|nr:hypothetical protein [Saprospiraceae bacterium]
MKTLHNKIDGRILKERILTDTTPRTTISFYQYYHLKNVNIFRDHLYQMLDNLDVMGRIYVSSEGINAQISVPDDNMDNFKQALNTITFLDNVSLNKAIKDDGKSF